MADQDQKPDQISIKVVDQQGEETVFKLKKTTKLSKIMQAYAQRMGFDIMSLKFLYDGNKVKEDDTPNSLDIEDDDTLEVHIEQVGGGGVGSA